MHNTYMGMQLEYVGMHVDVFGISWGYHGMQPHTPGMREKKV